MVSGCYLLSRRDYPRLFIAITYDFIQELRKQGSNLEVLAPEHLRESFKQEVALLGRLYGE